MPACTTAAIFPRMRPITLTRIQLADFPRSPWLFTGPVFFV